MSTTDKIAEIEKQMGLKPAPPAKATLPAAVVALIDSAIDSAIKKALGKPPAPTQPAAKPAIPKMPDLLPPATPVKWNPFEPKEKS